jgi:hypothetical protein
MVGAIAALAACADTAAPRFISPDAHLGNIPGRGSAPLTTNTPVYELFKVCKVYSGAVGPAVTVTVTAPGVSNFDVVLNNNECRSVWVQGGSTLPLETVSVTEAVPTGYTATWTKATLVGGVVSSTGGSGNTASGDVGANPLTGVVVTFTNTEVVIPPPPPAGCTYTQGYWKTHSIHGPASKPDAGWDNVGGPDADFFTSGKSWLEIFNTPVKGSKYIQLAHQYMAAKLNVLNGTSAPANVLAAIAAAEDYFTNGGTIPAGAAGLLGSYNEGAVGPGHCD